MRKFLLLTMMCVLGLFAVNAQNLSIVEIGADKNPDYESNYYLPVYDAAKDAISQQIYTAEEMGDNTGAIMTVGFKLGNTRSAQTRKYEVYLKSTELDEFDVTHYIDLDEADKVFDGDVEISGEMDSWFTITLDKAFNYTGGNILLAVYDKTGVGLSEYHYFYKYAASGRALYSKGNFGTYDMLNLGTGIAISYVNQIQFGMATEATVAVSTDSVALGNVKVGEYWAEESAVKSATFNIQTNATLVTSVSCDNAFFTLNYDLTATPIVVKVGYDKTAGAGEQTATITIKANDVEDITIPVTATAYTPAEADVYELAKEITFTNDAFADTPEFANLNDDYNLPEEVNAGKTPDVVYSFELEEEHTVIVNVDGTNAVAAIYSEDFAGKGGPKADNNYGGIVPAKTTFFFDFNDGSLEAFNLRDDDNDGKKWEITSGKLISYSWISYSAITPDNYVFTKEAYAITDASKVTYKVNAVTGSTDHYAVVVSEDGENFEIVFEEDYNQTAQADKEVNLSAYAGKMLYIGFRHFDCTGQYHIDIDDFQLTDGSGMTRGENAEPQIKVSYPAGKYYLVAAAEDQFSISVTLDIAPPATPDTLFATAINETSIALKWAAVEDVDGYNVYNGETFLATVTDTTYVAEGLESNKTYYFVVTAVKNNIESFKTKPAYATTNDYVIAAPTNVAVTAVDEFSVKLTWDAVENAQSYNIYVGEETISLTETAYVFEGLMPNTQYCYEVTAVRNAQETEKVRACGNTKPIDFNAEDLVTEFFYDFNDQSLEDFMLLDADDDGNNWTIAKDNNSANEGEYILKSYSDGIAATDNYIYTKRPYRITETSVVTLDARSGTGGMDAYKGEHYAVVVSENGTDWTVVFEETIDTTVWVSPVVSLAEYAGKGVLVGIRHYNSKVYFLSVDNFRLTTSPVDEPEEPGDGPDEPGVNPDEPGDGPDQPGVNPDEPGVNPDEPGDNPETPADSTQLAAPVVVADTVTATTVTLSWNAVDSAASYNVYMDSVLVANVTDTVYTVDSLTAETTYSFFVTAVADTLESVASNVVTVTTLKVEGIVENAVAFGIYPNPAVDRVVIETESTIESVSIYTLTGVMIYSEVETNNTINVSDLNSGVYFIKVVTSEGESVQRFIKK